jgi:hypothetical protein
MSVSKPFITSDSSGRSLHLQAREQIMSWFAAHLILYVERKDHDQDCFPLWENIVLIEADSEEEAFAKAEQRGREDEDADDSLRLGGKPARLVFAGVRKLTECQDADKRPGDGTEVSYIEMEVGSKKAIEKLLGNKPVSIKFMEKFRDTALGE